MNGTLLKTKERINMLTFINIILALITVCLSFWNVKFMINERFERQKFKIFIGFSSLTTNKEKPKVELPIVFENLGNNLLVDSFAEISYKFKSDQQCSLGTLKEGERRTIIYNLNKFIEEHLNSTKNKNNYEIPITFSFFNKFFNKYVIERRKLELTIQNDVRDKDTLYIKIQHLYIESRKHKEYKK